MEGQRTAVAPVLLPGCQVYEVPPDAVRVAQAPAHTCAGELPAVILGGVLTFTVTVAVAVQPDVLPISVYTVADAGETVALAPFMPPGIQV